MMDRERRILWTVVAPHMGAWIEIHHLRKQSKNDGVAPHESAWIEMIGQTGQVLKQCRTLYGCVGRNGLYVLFCVVAPYMGAWIEMYDAICYLHDIGRTPHGCVGRNMGEDGKQVECNMSRHIWRVGRNGVPEEA